MVKLTWKILANQDAVLGLNKLYNCDKMPFPETYTAGRIADACKSQMQKAHELNMNILRKWAKKDEKGELLQPANGEYHFEEGNKAKYENELTQLSDNSFEIKGNKIHVSKIPAALLTGAEAIALTDILDGIDSLN